MITNRTNYYSGDTQIVRIDAKQREISKSLFFPDLDGDGVSEMFLWNDNGFYVYSLNFDLILSITEDFKKNPLRNVLVDDINNNGKDEITLFADNSVSVYSY